MQLSVIRQLKWGSIRLNSMDPYHLARNPIFEVY